MRAIKHYWAFTNWIYRLVVLLVIPLALIGVNAWGYFSDDRFILAIALVLYFMFLPVVDIMSDCWLLPGFYAKGNGSLEFLQSTTKFKTMIRDVVIVDILRRVAVYMGLFGMMYFVFVSKDVPVYNIVWNFGYMPVLELFLSQTAVFVSRFFRGANQVYACAMFTVAANAFFMTGTAHLANPIKQMIIIALAVMAIVMMILTVGVSLKKVRESYYDK